MVVVKQWQWCWALGWAKIPPPDSQFVYPSAILGDVQGGTNSSQGATGWTAALEGGFWPRNTGKGWEDEAIFLWVIFTGLLQIYCDSSLSCEKPWILGEVLPKWLWQDPTEPTKGSVAWWYRAQPGHQGTARGFKWLWFSWEPRCDFPSRMRW